MRGQANMCSLGLAPQTDLPYNNSSCSHSHSTAPHHSVAEGSRCIQKVKKISLLSSRVGERVFFPSVCVFNLIGQF